MSGRIDDAFNFAKLDYIDGPAMAVQTYMVSALCLLLLLILIFAQYSPWKKCTILGPPEQPCSKRGTPTPPANFLTKYDHGVINKLPRFRGRRLFLDQRDKDFLKAASVVPAAIWGKEKSLFDYRFPLESLIKADKQQQQQQPQPQQQQLPQQQPQPQQEASKNP